MKLTVLSESDADEAAVNILAVGILGREVESAVPLAIRDRGWPAVLNVLPGVLRHLHYSGADGLIVVVDSDDSVPHHEKHEEEGGREQSCRLCKLVERIEAVQSTLRARQGMPPVKTAVGLAVPAIEAWYLAGQQAAVTESAWISSQSTRKFPFTRPDLKRMVYGTDRPSLALETECAVREARKIVQEGKLAWLEQAFPGGFGTLADQIRAW